MNPTKNQTRFHSLLLGLTLLFLLPTAALAAQDMNLSQEMRTLVLQAQSTYISRFGTTADKLVNESPDTFASILGVTLQRQGNYADANKKYIPHYWSLRKQCTALLEKIAKTKAYKNPRTGEPMPAQVLLDEFHSGLRGEPNRFFIEKMGINPATVNTPMILAQVSVPTSQEPVTPNPKLIKKKKGIDLLGETASAAESSSNAPPSAGGKPNFTKGETIRVSDKYGAPWVKDQICPNTNTPRKSIHFDTESPSGKGYVVCGYDAQGRLEFQSPNSRTSNRKHGVYYKYEIRDGVYYLRRTTEYAHGKRHGKELEYSVYKSKQPYLFRSTNCVDDHPEGLFETWAIDQRGNRYLEERIQYSNQGNDYNGEEYEVSPSGRHYLYIIKQVRNRKTVYSERRNEYGKWEVKSWYQNGKQVRYLRND